MSSSIEQAEEQAIRHLFTYTEQLPLPTHSQEELATAAGDLVVARQLAIEGIARLRPEFASVDSWNSYEQPEPTVIKGPEAYSTWMTAKALWAEKNSEYDCHLRLLLPLRIEDGLQLEAKVGLMPPTEPMTMFRVHNGKHEAFDSLVDGKVQKIGDKTLQVVKKLGFMRWGSPPYIDPVARVDIVFGGKGFEAVNYVRGDSDITHLPEVLYETRQGGSVSRPAMYAAMNRQLWRELCILRTSVDLEELM